MNDDIELIDATRPPAENRRPTAAPRARSTLVLVALVAVVSMTVLSLNGGGDEPIPDPNPIPPTSELPVDVAVGTIDGDGPVLERDTDLSLMAGGPNSPLRVLDLDTGDLTVSAAVVEPRFVAGTSLVYRSEESSWARAGLDDLRSGPVAGQASSFRPNGEPAHVVPHDERSVWLTWPSSDRRRVWQLIDLATMSVLREVRTPPQARVLGGDTPFTGPEVMGFTTGGVHQLTEDGSYRQVLEGRLVAVGRDEVLVRQCLPGTSCVLRWFERDTWIVSNRPAPEGNLVNGRLVANGRLLAGSVARPAFGADLYDVQSGERIRSLGPTPLGDVAASPDGGWLLRRLFARVEVIEVATGMTVEVSALPLGGDSVIWLESP